MNRDDTVEQLLEQFRRSLRQSEIVLGGESVLVAVSGGVDSVTLFDMLRRLAGPLRLDLSIIHLDHQLRDESAADAEFVRELARSADVRIYAASVDIREIASEEGRSIEEVARAERYDFFERISRRHKFDLVVTGHTADDNAETLLMNLIRGAGVTGLAGIPVTRSLGGRTLLARPMLWLSKQQILEYAEAAELKWREDETNQSNRFTRNRVRSELIPLLKEFNPSIVSTLNRTSELMRRFDQFLSTSVATSAASLVREKSSKGDRIELDVGQLKHLLPAIQGEVVQRVVSDYFGLSALPYDAVQRILELVWKETGTKADVIGRHEALRDREAIVLMRTTPVAREVDKTFKTGGTVRGGNVELRSSFVDPGDVRFSDNPDIEFVSADSLGDQLVLRSWNEGDRFRPLGMRGEKKISDFLVDMKIPLDQKKEVLVVVHGDDVIWVCGMRVDDRYRVTKKTTKALKLELKRT